MIACLLSSTASCGAGLLLQQGHAVHIVLGGWQIWTVLYSQLGVCGVAMSTLSPT